MDTLATRGTFLPENYQVPDKAKQFMKLEVGDNHFRILSSPLLGWVFFNEENKPVRRSFEEGEFTHEELAELKAKRNDKGEFEGSRHFWIMLVWSYKYNAPKILELTQISIIKPLCGLIEDEDWGDLRGFDINIKREGTGKNDTEFTTTPKPHKPLAPEIEDVIETLDKSRLLDLNAIWKGEYPFQIYNW
jgi:hypothetical protein